MGYREVILANTFQSLSVVLEAMEMMGIEFENPGSKQDQLLIADVGSYPEVSECGRQGKPAFSQAHRELTQEIGAVACPHVGRAARHEPVRRRGRQEGDRCVLQCTRFACMGPAWRLMLPFHRPARRNEYQLNDSAEVSSVHDRGKEDETPC